MKNTNHKREDRDKNPKNQVPIIKYILNSNIEIRNKLKKQNSKFESTRMY